MRKKVGILGPGKVGSALAMGLYKAGWPLTAVAGPRMETVRELAARVEAAAAGSKEELVSGSEVIFLTVPDDFIEKVAGELSASAVRVEGKFFYHTSGALGSKALSSLKERGAFIASLHPLQSFADRKTGWALLTGCRVALEGDREAVGLGEEITKALKAEPLILTPGTKTLYHAAACIASNYLVTIEYIAARLFNLAGIKTEDFFSIAGPLLQGTLKNIKSRGVPGALTGPVSRGDIGTVGRHLEAVRERAPEYLSFYQILLFHTVHAAFEQGSIDRSKAGEFLRLLKSTSGEEFKTEEIMTKER